MSRIFLNVVACVLACQLVFVIAYPDEQFEIRAGNCSNAVVGDLVFQDHVHLTRIPFVKRNTTSSWHGDQMIYCILALSLKEQEKGSTVFIKEGGLNHPFITLEFHSTKGHGLEYNVNVFGKWKQ